MKTMMKKTSRLAGGVAAGVLLGVLTAGCQTDRNAAGKVRGDEFPPEGTPRSPSRVAEVQAASGARADATLRPFHFDAGRLNSLGEQKLDLMLMDDDLAEPLVVFLDLPEKEGRQSDREQAVTAYLRERGLTDEQIRLRPGTNPDYMSPALKPTKGEGKAPEAMTLQLAPMGMGADKK